VGIPSIKMFKAFIANWTENLEGPLENILEHISEEKEITITILAFKSQNEMKAALVVPLVHPGPFKNVGSSTIPSMIQKSLETKFRCVVSVPHGISGHELDLASQSENKKVIKKLPKVEDFREYTSKATPFLTFKRKDTTANCQLFGDCVILTFTLAPKTMEDLPLDLNESIVEQAKEKGLSCVLPIDAHNSIQGPFKPQTILPEIEEVTADALNKSLSYKQTKLSVGAAKIIPTKFSLEDGIGPGGITAIVTRVDNKTACYVTIDGNNMVTGLREKILTSLREIGMDAGEILTTDTHMVNAIVMTERGYHPIGEKTDNTLLINIIKKVVLDAAQSIEQADSSWKQVKIPNVKVIGEKQIERLSSLVDKGMKNTKKITSIVFPLASTALLLLLAVL
jgi:putative membrane protein